MAKPKTPKSKAKPKRVQTRTIDKRPAFLAAYVETASLTAAAAAVGVDRAMHYRWMEDPEYGALYAIAREQAGETLEDDAVHWARVGIFEPLTFQGQFQYADYREHVLCTLADGREVLEAKVSEGVEVVSTRKVKVGIGRPLGVFRRSEGLMARLLKAFMPSRYADRGAVELTGKDGGPIENSITVTFVKPEGK